MGISARLLTQLNRQSIISPVPVQSQAIPPLRESRHVVIEAPTGSGKTLAFLLPLVERLMDSLAPGPRALVVTPTRELAMQVERVFTGLQTGLKMALLYGGIGYAVQEAALRDGVDLVIGTPGRILDMLSRRRLSLSRVQILVLDEGDEMLDAGFAPDVERILEACYQPQIVLASATMPRWVTSVIDRHLEDPVRVRVRPDAAQTLEHGLVRVRREQKLQTLSRLLNGHLGSVIVFGRTKHGVRKLNRDLRRLGHKSNDLQGDLTQAARDRTMDAFRELQTHILVATNVAARGLDISQVDLVVNYDLPDSPEWLTHRVGRTARMGARGRALTLVTPEDERAWRALRRQGAPDLPQVDVDHLLSGGDWRYVAAALVDRPEGRIKSLKSASRSPRRGRGRGRVAPPRAAASS